MEIFLQKWKYCLIDVWLGSKNASGSLDAPCEMAALNSFVLQYLCHKQFVFCFQKWQWLLISQGLHSTTLVNEGMHKIKSNIFNLQEWHQNTQNCKSLFQQTFIAYKTFTAGIKAENLPRTTRFGLWSFYKDAFSWMTTFKYS